MKRHIRPRCLLFEKAGRQRPVFLDWCDRWSIRGNQLISATFILIAPKEVELANLRIFQHRYQPISIYGNCILWPESTVQTQKMINSQFFVARALVASYIVAFFSNAILKYFFNILEDLLLSWGRHIARDTTKSEYVVWKSFWVVNIARKFWRWLHCRATDGVAKSTLVKGKFNKLSVSAFLGGHHSVK